MSEEDVELRRLSKKINDLENRLGDMANSLATRYRNQSQMRLDLDSLTILAESNLKSHCNQSRFSEELLYQLSIILKYITLPWYVRLFKRKLIRETKECIDRIVKTYGKEDGENE